MDPTALRDPRQNPWVIVTMTTTRNAPTASVAAPMPASAELVVLGETSTGAADDLARATDLARDMVMRHGMDETVGPVVYGDEAPQFLAPRGPTPPWHRETSETTAREIERAVRDLVQDAQTAAVAILSTHRAALDAGAMRLQERETLSRDELPRIVGELVPGQQGRPSVTQRE